MAGGRGGRCLGDRVSLQQWPEMELYAGGCGCATARPSVADIVRLCAMETRGHVLGVGNAQAVPGRCLAVFAWLLLSCPALLAALVLPRVSMSLWPAPDRDLYSCWELVSLVGGTCPDCSFCPALPSPLIYTCAG